MLMMIMLFLLSFFQLLYIELQCNFMLITISIWEINEIVIIFVCNIFHCNCSILSHCFVFVNHRYLIARNIYYVYTKNITLTFKWWWRCCCHRRCFQLFYIRYTVMPCLLQCHLEKLIRLSLYFIYCFDGFVKYVMHFTETNFL